MKLEKFLLPDNYSESMLIDLLLSEIKMVLYEIGTVDEVYISQGIHTRDTKFFIKLPEDVPLHTNKSKLFLENVLKDCNTRFLIYLSNKKKTILSLGFADISLNLCEIDIFDYENKILAENFDFYMLDGCSGEYSKAYANYIRWKCNNSLYSAFILKRISKSENWGIFLRMMENILSDSWEEDFTKNCNEKNIAQYIKKYIKEKEHDMLKDKNFRNELFFQFRSYGISPILWFGKELFF